MDGVSLTVSALGSDFFEVSLNPTTLDLTNLGRKQVGDVVNLEVDVIAKYVERLLARARHSQHLCLRYSWNGDGMTTFAELATVEEALEALRHGRPVLVTDDETGRTRATSSSRVRR